MTKQEQIAQLALGRAATRCTMVVIATDNQRALVEVLRGLNPKAVLSMIGTTGVRVHGVSWGRGRQPAGPAVPKSRNSVN